MADVRTEVAKREEQAAEQPRASALVAKYKADFTTVLPSHLRADTWVRVAQGALKRGKPELDQRGRPTGRSELEVAALANPSAFLSTMLDAARLGLEPGTEQFWLRSVKNKGRPEIQGIVGYEGLIELMYRAGAVATVVCKVVRERDEYKSPDPAEGRDVPKHDYPPFSGAKTRGKIVGVYAYAKMMTGAFSNVIELGQEDIDLIKKSADGANSQYSPWNTHEEAMWKKSAVRQLSKWVPTSAERIPSGGTVHVDSERDGSAMSLPMPAGGLDEHWVEYDDQDDVHDAEVVDHDPVTGEVRA